MSTYATLEPAQLEVVPGEERTCQLTVRNNSDIVEAYQLDVVGAASAWSVVEPSVLHVYPGAEGIAVVRIAPPRSSRVGVGEVPFAVRALPSEHPGDAVAPEAVVTVLPFTATTAEILPRTSKGRRAARHETAVDNRGNVPLTARLSGVDPDGQLQVRVRPEVLTVAPGQAAFANVGVRNRRRLWHGAPVTRGFQVIVETEADPPIALDASTVQTPIFPRATTKLVAALLALLLLLVGAWYLLLKPAVKSAAKDAVDAPLAQVAAQASKAGDKADVAGKKADQAQANAPGGGPSVSPQPASPAPKGSTTVVSPTTVRLNAALATSTTPGTTAFTSPARTTTIITDIVLENPQGDTGRIDIVLDTTTILTLSLANFRDLDYHFVSPLVVNPGKALSIKVTCQAPGPPIAGAAAGQCRDSVFASGTKKVVTPPPAG
jgi:hypothetical protein